MVLDISIKKWKERHVTGGLRYGVLGVEIKVMEKSRMSLNTLFLLRISKGIFNVLV